ncbi:MAG: hypothetical protein WBF71_01445 [Microthrixaceae bacterium]
MRFTLDREADAVFLYLVDEIEPGSANRSSIVTLPFQGASVIAVLDADGRALGLEFIPASAMFTGKMLMAMEEYQSGY